MAGLHWYHMPIPDMEVPGLEFEVAWNKDGGTILRSLRQGKRVLIHCAGGLGRSGMIAAKILSAFGENPQSAISAVREARPGAIETALQAHHILHGPCLAASDDGNQP